MFSLADKLDHFTHPLESGLKVAFMGKKTLRWDDGASPHEVQFNYSSDPNAQALFDWFERIAETERGYIELERTVKYDKLGVQNALIRCKHTRSEATGYSGAVSAAAGPRGEERKLSAYGTRAGSRFRQ